MKDEPKPKPASALPFKTVAEELTFLRKTLRDLVGTYAAQLEAEIAHLHATVIADGESKKKLPGNRVSDLRDMLMMLRSLEVKPAKGRRRDLKKVENLIEELRTIADRWS
ncbi:MAG: hypothetical protein ABJF10_12225 [Chthoniobacter sp.]|uniref:hypothetical protein n=1 Tax=Chthoniobacter sp. TaxID=2510640 RepID=UPI0032A4C29C